MSFFYSTVDSANCGLRLVYTLEMECPIVGMPLLVGTEPWVLSPLGTTTKSLLICQNVSASSFVLYTRVKKVPIVFPTYAVSIARALSTPTPLLGNLTSSQWQSWCYKPR